MMKNFYTINICDRLSTSVQCTCDFSYSKIIRWNCQTFTSEKQLLSDPWNYLLRWLNIGINKTVFAVESSRNTGDVRRKFARTNGIVVWAIINISLLPYCVFQEKRRNKNNNVYKWITYLDINAVSEKMSTKIICSMIIQTLTPSGIIWKKFQYNR